MNGMLKTGLFLVLMAITGMWACGDSNDVVEPVELQDTAIAQISGIQAINEKIKNDPNNPNFYFERATFVMNSVQAGEVVSTNHINLAINDLKRALTIDSTVATYHYELGNIYYQLTRSIDAMDEYMATIEYDPEHTDAMIKIAQIYLVFENYDQAMKYVNMALKVDEYIAEAYFVKGWIYKESADTFKAASSFATAREVNPEYYEADMQLASLYAVSDDDRAIQYYDAALATIPNSIEALYAKGLYCQEHEQLDLALDSYNRILEVDSTYPLAHFNLGFVNLIYLQDFEQAITHYTKAVTYVPDYYEAYLNRGLCYENLGRNAEAEADFKKALEIKPDYDLAAEGLSRIGARP